MRSLLAGAAVAAAVLTSVAGAVPADAATKYSSCAKLNQDFPSGVSKSKAAAKKQVRLGNSLPAYGKRAQAVYAQNKGSLDRDKDGTACEN